MNKHQGKYLQRGTVNTQSKSSIHEEFQKFENFRGRANKLISRADSSSSSSSSSDGAAARAKAKRNPSGPSTSHHAAKSKEAAPKDPPVQNAQKEPPSKSHRGQQKQKNGSDESAEEEPDFNMRQSILQHSLHGQTDRGQEDVYKVPEDLEPERDVKEHQQYREPKKGKSKERRDDSIYICNTNQSPIKYDALSRNISQTNHTMQTSRTTIQLNNTDKVTQRSVVNVAGNQETPSFLEKARKDQQQEIEDAIAFQKQLDEQFVIFMLQVEERYQQNLSKKYRKQVEQWSKVLCQIIQPQGKDYEMLVQIRKNRNLYAVKLLDQILSLKYLEDEFLEEPPKSLVDLPGLNPQETQRGLSKRFQQTVKDMNSYGNAILQEKEKPEQPQAQVKDPSATIDHAGSKPTKPAQQNDLAVPQFLKPPKTLKDNWMRSPLTNGASKKIQQSKSPRMPGGEASKGLSIQMIPTKQGAKQNRCASSMASRAEPPAGETSLLAQKEAKMHAAQQQQEHAVASMVHLEQQMTGLHQTIGHQKTQIENLEAFIEKKHTQQADMKQQIKELLIEIEEKEVMNQKQQQLHAKDKKLYEKQEREAKLREALVLKQTDIIDNITRQLQKANDDKLKLKEMLDESKNEEGKYAQQLERMQQELEQRLEQETSLKDYTAQINRLDQLIERKDQEIQERDQEIEQLQKEKSVLKTKNLKYQELSEKLLQQLEDRDNDEESKDRRVEKVRIELEEQHQEMVQQINQKHQEEFQELEDRMNQEFHANMVRKEQEIDSMRDDYIKVSDDLKRKESQIAHLEQQIRQMQLRDGVVDTSLQLQQQQQMQAEQHQHQNQNPPNPRSAIGQANYATETTGHGAQSQPIAVADNHDLTKSELIFQRCENYIKNSHRGDKASHRGAGGGGGHHQEPSFRRNAQQQMNPLPPSSLLVRKSSSENEDRFINVDNVPNHQINGKQPEGGTNMKQFDRQSNGSFTSQNSRGSNHNGAGGAPHKINRSMNQTQNSVSGINDSKIVSSSQVLIGALAAMNNKDKNGGFNGGGAAQQHGIPPLNHHNLSQLNIQENNYVPLKTQNIPPKSTRSSNQAFDDSAKHGVKDLIGGGGAISGISAVASSVNVSQLNPNLSVHKSVQGLSGLPPKALQMTNTSQQFSNMNYQNPKTLKEIYNSMTSQQSSLQPQQQQSSAPNNTTLNNNQTHMHVQYPTRIQQAHQELEDTSNFEKTMPSPGYNHNGVSQETALPNNIHHGEHTQKLIQDIQNVQRHSTEMDRGLHVQNSASDQNRQYLESQYGPITATQSVLHSQNNLSGTMGAGLPIEQPDDASNGHHKKRYSQFEQRQDIQTYRTLCQEEDTEVEQEELAQTGQTSEDPNPHIQIQEQTSTMDANDRHQRQQTEVSSEYAHQQLMYNQMSLKVPMPNVIQGLNRRPSQPELGEEKPIGGEHKRQGFQLNLGQVNEHNQNNPASNLPSNNGQSTSRGAYHQFQGARQLSSRLQTFRKEEQSNKKVNDRCTSSGLGTNEGVRSNDRYDRLYDQLIDEEDLLNEQSQLREHYPQQERPQTEQQPKVGKVHKKDRESSPQSYYDNFTQRGGRVPGHEVNQSDVDLQRHLYAIQQKHFNNNVDTADMISESDFTASRHQTNNHNSTASVSQTNRKIRGEESTASRQLRLIQNRYAKQSAQMMDDNDQFEQIIDEEDHEMQSSSRDSYPYRRAAGDKVQQATAGGSGANTSSRQQPYQMGRQQPDVGLPQQQFPAIVGDDEDEDLFKLSQFLTKRGNQNSIDQTRQTSNNSQASQKTGSAGHGAAQISMRNIESANASEVYGGFGNHNGNQQHAGLSAFQNQGPPVVQMTESMMKSKFRPNSRKIDDDKSPMYCPDTVDKNFDKFVDDLL